MNPNQNLSVPQFETTPPQESRHNKKRVARLVSEVALASLGVIGGVACGTDNGTETKATETIYTVPEINSKTMDTMSYQSFAALDTATRVDHMAPVIDQYSTDTWKIMKDFLSPAQLAVVSGNLPSNKEDYTDQDILSRFAIDNFYASVQGDTSDDIDRGRKIQSVIMDPNNPNFNHSVDLIGNGQGGVKVVWKAVGNDYPRLQNTSFRGHQIGDAGAEIIHMQDVRTGEEGYALFTLFSTSDGASVWQHTDQFATTDMNIRHEITQAIETSHS